MDGLRNIFARNCEIRRITKPEAAAFLDANHRYGDAACRYRYGMFCRRSTGEGELRLPAGTLVAVAEFSSARTMRDGSRSCEWIRYASLAGVRVQGGMGKMLAHFVEEVRPDDVMSYADPDSEDEGRVYEKLGFKSEGTVSKPNFSCVKYRLSTNRNN
ncbi:MAG: hypothetical protein MJY42_04015 [Bacteroidales bacterium]|nr:hypothetical protein [Bacteroidales bacterium]